ncbi:MAG: V-type ATPase subunit [Candidatus Nanohaloarchaea archaeon]
MYARISAKRKKLLDRKDYENLLKMGPNEIARKLGELDYKEDIDELGASHEGLELAEMALARNVSRTMAGIVEIAPESLKPVIAAYLRRYDIENLKKLLRWKHGDERGEVEKMLLPAGSYGREKLMKLADQDLDDIKTEIRFPAAEVDYTSYLEDAEDLKEMERALDRAYYDEIKDVADSTGNNWFRKFVSDEIEYQNLKIALRLKKYGKQPEQIDEWLLNGNVSEAVELARDAENLERAVSELESLDRFEAVGEDATLEEIEHGIEVERLREALKTLHIDPLGMTSILGYIVAKMVEVKNLRMLLRAKETGIQNPETIRDNLVTA